MQGAVVNLFAAAAGLVLASQIESTQPPTITTVPSVASQQATPTAAVPALPPGPSMKEVEASLKRDLPAMGSVHIVVKTGERVSGDKYDIDSAVMSDCRLTMRQVRQREFSEDNGTLRGVSNRQFDTYTIPFKDVDVNRVLAREVGTGGRLATSSICTLSPIEARHFCYKRTGMPAERQRDRSTRSGCG